MSRDPAANELDRADAQATGKNAAFLDRLLLDGPRIEAMAAAVEFIASAEDPVGKVTASWSRPNGLEVRKVRLPLGVVLMIYEKRTNLMLSVQSVLVRCEDNFPIQ